MLFLTKTVAEAMNLKLDMDNPADREKNAKDHMMCDSRLR